MSIHRTDLCAGLVVSTIGIAALAGALAMPTFADRNGDPLTAPGITPGIISGVIAVLGIVLLLRAMAGRGPRDVPVETWPPGAALRTVFTIVTALIYGVVLFGQVPFLPATAGFVFVFTLGAELMHPGRSRSIVALCLWAALLAGVSALAIQYLFTDLFLVRLPG
ncbi:tripartite tricarboxylate transporter TctB family protein [Oceaniglobus trochenteri]|uniref:tripartite tricarboxylate transporter TctB family protein n=1 Tax=Oceaniglobus trochenteri TaxID=2763260 RepID=UPI001CFFE8BE|nr:tripartite tricarboxylate transporter TctB family protein [Oceaniglobus trochenteri]